jgi:hypothetical protein
VAGAAASRASLQSAEIMEFSEPTVRRCWHLARGRCECHREGHGHDGRCNEPLALHLHGLLTPNGWIASPWQALEAGGSDEAENAEALCWRCYERVTREAKSGTG